MSPARSLHGLSLALACFVGAGSIRVSPEYFQICFGVGIGFDFMRRIGD